MHEDIVAIIRAVGLNPLIAPGPNDSLFSSGLLDSFSLPALIEALEQKFGIKIPDGDLVPRKFDTVALIAAYIESRS